MWSHHPVESCLVWRQKVKTLFFCPTGHLKGARLKLSLVLWLFNLGNNKNIKWIPVFLCYNRSTTVWKHRDSETKPTTSKRSKKGRSTDRRPGRWRERPSGTSESQTLMSVRSGGGRSRNWQRAVELLRETGRPQRSNGNPNEAQLPTKQSSQSLQPTASRTRRKARISLDGRRRFTA